MPLMHVKYTEKIKRESKVVLPQWVIAMSLASVLGLLTALQWLPLVVILGGILLLVAVYAWLGSSTNAGSKDILFWSMVVLTYLSPLLHKVLGIRFFGLMEAILLAAVPLLIYPAIGWYRRVRWAGLLVALIVLFIMLGVLSTIFGRSEPLAAAYQFIADTKFFLMLLAGLYLAWSPRTERVFWSLVQWGWAFLLSILLWEWLSPSSYYVLFPYSNGSAIHPFWPVPGKATGPFQHASYLAFHAALLMLLAVIRGYFRKSGSLIAAAVVYGFILLATGERQEIVAATGTLLLVWSLMGTTERFWKRTGTAVILGIAIAALMSMYIKDDIERETQVWGFSGYDAVTHPRPAMYLHAFDIANQYAPLGSGLGTFGGAGAAKFDRSLYLERGFGGYSWYLELNVLMDTYWPHFIAERGWLGGAIFLAIIVVLIWHGIRNGLAERRSDQKFHWILAVGALVLAVLITPTSPILEDPGLAFLALVLYGIAEKKSGPGRKDSLGTNGANG